MSAKYPVEIYRTTTVTAKIDCKIITCVRLSPLFCQNKTMTGIEKNIPAKISWR